MGLAAQIARCESSMRILMLGDIFGAPGRRCAQELVPLMRERWELDLVVANGENAAGGLGLNATLAKALLRAGVDVITTGNHVWRHRDLAEYMTRETRVLRPANYPPGAPGKGWVVVKSASGLSVVVINLEGRVGMNPLDCPFQGADRLLALPEIEQAPIRLVDFHAEATSEKVALGRYLDGRVSALCGTHTHVQTADQKILPSGTAYITDLGLTGPHDSVIGMKPSAAIRRFLTQRQHPFAVASGDVRMQGALLDLDPDQGLAQSITRVDEPWEN